MPQMALPDQPTQQTTQQISIQDLQNLLMVVDLAAQRGAFRAPELSQIGGVFDRINQFLQSVAPPQDNQAPSQPPAPQPVQQMPDTQSVQQMPTPVMPMTPPFSPKVGV
jgi:hypothetical protein